jgi:hypothetical protein
MPKDAKRRFVGLDTQEVSLVDSPANEVEFLVVKNDTEDQKMSATAAAKKQREAEGDDTDESSDVSKALAHVDGIVAKITQLVTNKSEHPAPPAEGGDDDEEDTETPTEKAAKSLKAVLAKCGMDAAMSKQVYSSLKAAGFDLSAKAAGKNPFPPPKGGKAPEDDGEEEKPAKTKKSAELVDEADAPLTMAALAAAVQKAAAFTPARIKALTDAQEILKLVLEAVTPGTSPDSKVPAVSSHSNASGIDDLTKPNTKPSVPTMKSDSDQEIVKTIKSLAGAVTGLVDRVQAIEKARPGSNSVTDEGGTDSNVQKSSMWKGVL